MCQKLVRLELHTISLQPYLPLVIFCFHWSLAFPSLPFMQSELEAQSAEAARLGRVLERSELAVGDLR